MPLRGESNPGTKLHHPEAMGNSHLPKKDADARIFSQVPLKGGQIHTDLRGETINQEHFPVLFPFSMQSPVGASPRLSTARVHKGHSRQNFPPKTENLQHLKTTCLFLNLF